MIARQCSFELGGIHRQQWVAAEAEPNPSKRVAAALGYIGLVNYNRVTVAAMGDGIVADTGSMRGRRRVAQMLDFIGKIQPTGGSNMAEACKRFARLSCGHRYGWYGRLLSSESM